jgi:hypothetical protein
MTKNLKIFGLSLLLFFSCGKVFAQNTSWNLNPYVDYTNYIDLQAEVKGYIIDDDIINFTVRNLSNSEIFFYVEFMIVDICDKSHSQYWGGGVSLKSGASDVENIRLATGCKKDKNLKTSIASITCKVTGFKDVTKEANKYKEEQVQKQQKLDEEKAKREKIAFDKEVQQIKEQREKDRIVAEKEETTNSTPTSTSYYNNTTTTNSKPRQPTWQERDAQIKAENQRIYEQNQQRIAETQRRSQEQSEQFVNGATELIGLVGNIFEQARIDREKKEAKQEEAAQRERQRRQEEEVRLAETARQKAQLIVLRNSFFDEFPEGGVPLSSQKINTKELYYFVYLFNKNEIGETRPTIILSDTFVIAQYKDGTWPFKSNIIFDIEKLADNGTITLVGYFTTKTLAEEMRNNFLEIANNSNLVIEKINYKGKKLNLSSSDDFWENGSGINKIESSGKAKLILAKGDEDFWETGQEQKKLSGDKKKVAPVKKKDKK